MIWLRHLKNFINRLFKKEIPFQIGENELLVRGIGHFIFYSINDKKLKREAFLPPPDKADVSLLRRNYTTDDFCKNHGMKLQMTGYNYCGLATFFCCQVNEINADSLITIKPILKGSPIDQYEKYIELPPVFTSTPGLPMHADLIYPYPAVKGKVNTSYRLFAQQMIKKANFHEDPNPGLNGKWLGPKLLP